MGGNKTRTPEIITPDYPKDAVRGIIDDAGSRIRDNTDKLEGKAKGYESDSDKDAALLGTQTAGYAPMSASFTSYEGVGGAKNFVEQGSVGGKKDKFGVKTYNTINDYTNPGNMFDKFQSIYKGEKGAESPYKNIQQALRVAEKKGFVDDGSRKGFGTSQAQGLYEMLAKNVKDEFGVERKAKPMDPGAETLTGQTMSQAMGGYRDNFDSTTGSMTKKSKNFIDNYESDLLKSKSFNQASRQAKQDQRTYANTTDRYRDSAYNVMNQSTGRAVGMINTGRNQALKTQNKAFTEGMTTISSYRDQAMKAQLQGFSKAKKTTSAAADTSSARMDDAASTAQTSVNQAAKFSNRRMNVAADDASTRISDAYSTGISDMNKQRQNAKNQSKQGFKKGTSVMQDSAEDAYGTNILGSTLTQQGSRATEGYAKTSGALTGVGSTSQTYTTNADYNMLKNKEFETEKAAPPTLRMADTMQQELRRLGGFAAYGGFDTAGTRGNIRSDVSTTYNFGFGDTDDDGNYKRKFDRTTQTQTKATPFYNEIRSTRKTGGGFNFAPTRSDYQMTAAKDFEARSRGSASQRYYNRFMGGYSPRG